MTMTADPSSTSNNNNHEGAAAVDEAENLLRKNADAKALLVGLEAGEVGVQALDWANLLKSALAVKVHVFGSGFEVQIGPEDFGIVPNNDEERQAWNRNLKLGKIGTLPEQVRRRTLALKGKMVNHFDHYRNETHFGDLIKLGDAICGECREHLPSTDPSVDVLQEHADSVHPVKGGDQLEFESPAAAAEAIESQLAHTRALQGKQPGWNFGEWLAGARKIAKEYDDLASEIYNNWDGLMATMRSEYRLIGVGVYARLKAMNKPGLGTLDEEVDRFVNQRMAKIVNDRESVKSGMRMSWEVTDIPLASQLAQDQADAAKILADSAKVRSEQRIMWEIEQEKIRTAREQIKEGAKTLLSDLRANTNALVYEQSRKVLEAIQNNGEVPGGSIKGLRNLIDNIERLSLLPDAQIDSQMAQIRKLLKRSSLNDDVRETQSVMKRICIEAKLVLKELDRSTASSREVGVPDTLEGLKRVMGLSARTDVVRTLDLMPSNGSVASEPVSARDSSDRDI
jgi:hypothetical protein